ncbi:putative ATPase involved in pili and flagella biosynthesis [Corynebacterium glutamicum MT]|uniref:ATPase n=1 Tax=Corynebacterium glutamicum TaxID=1718 RepID=A0AB36I805_CORGT|nr:TadA family conjugal transfer-associated ATPase [Corynebacterium glutamicum]AGN17967.1 secretion ATPase [Corynebacterium glutamicum SCgG1]AGN20990.1 secretion ATPase [Corynebacterium glutamicum SCgG2]EGV40896.1 secretion ATPase protein [Corynebacterium glutamicum S9114]EOA64888.1 putative ATPase involved in pili and flagella biosynthesis [Corynebacterium glutamicum MT]EPP41955.1 secretion ATPase [Corynebacterium glutamicum Z188]
MTDIDLVVENVQRIIATKETPPTSAEIASLIREQAGVISNEDIVMVLRRLRSDSVGVGPLESLLALPGVTDVLVNAHDSVWIDRGQGVEKVDMDLGSEEAVRRLATRLALTCGRRLDDAQPFADGRITRDDGSVLRIHAVLAPLAESGTCISVRVLRQARLSLDDLINSGTVPEDIAPALRNIINQRRSFLVVGGTGTGKTTLLSAMLTEVPADQRIICIEDTAELHPGHPSTINLVSRQANVEGAGAVSMADLLKQSLRMRPDRIVVGEIRGAEVVDLLAAMNTGHDGGAGTIHANSISEVPARMEALAATGGLDRMALHSQLAAAVDIVLVMKHTPFGRKLAQLGVLRGNPVTTQVVWDVDHGMHEGSEEAWFMP